MIDNFKNLKPLLAFENPNAMYHIQILKRRKDNPDLSKSVKKLRSYYIRSLDDLEKCHESIIRECTENNARAYIDLNVKDVEKVALLVLKKAADLIYEKQYDAVKNVYDYACGNAPSFGSKLWMIDIDTKDDGVFKAVLDRLNGIGVPVLHVVHTLNGKHVLTRPFPCNKFEPLPDVSVIKHAITVLIAPDIEASSRLLG